MGTNDDCDQKSKQDPQLDTTRKEWVLVVPARLAQSVYKLLCQQKYPCLVARPWHLEGHEGSRIHPHKKLDEDGLVGIPVLSDTAILQAAATQQQLSPLGDLLQLHNNNNNNNNINKDKIELVYKDYTLSRKERQRLLVRQSTLNSTPLLERKRTVSPTTSRLSATTPTKQTCAGQRASFQYAELFAGIGGFSVALEALGGQCIFASEWESACRQVLLDNFDWIDVLAQKEESTSSSRGGRIEKNDKDTMDTSSEQPQQQQQHQQQQQQQQRQQYRPLLWGDITKVPMEAYPKPGELDLLVGGFPCQPFSALGKQPGLACPEKGSLFESIVLMLHLSRPKSFLLENVPGLLHDLSETLERIVQALQFPQQYLQNANADTPIKKDRSNDCETCQDQGKGDSYHYQVSYKICNARGLTATKRKRLYFIGFLEDDSNRTIIQTAIQQLSHEETHTTHRNNDDHDDDVNNTAIHRMMDKKNSFAFPPIPNLDITCKDILDYRPSGPLVSILMQSYQTTIGHHHHHHHRYLTPQQEEDFLLWNDVLPITDQQFDKLLEPNSSWRPSSMAWPNSKCQTLVSHYGKCVARGNCQLVPSSAKPPTGWSLHSSSSIGNHSVDPDNDNSNSNNSSSSSKEASAESSLLTTRDVATALMDKEKYGRNPPRRFSPRECARMMGFPNTFRLPSLLRTRTSLITENPTTLQDMNTATTPNHDNENDQKQDGGSLHENNIHDILERAPARNQTRLSAKQRIMKHRLKEKYRMLGNAVCPPLIAVLAGAVLAHLNRKGDTRAVGGEKQNHDNDWVIRGQLVGKELALACLLESDNGDDDGVKSQFNLEDFSSNSNQRREYSSIQ